MRRIALLIGLFVGASCSLAGDLPAPTNVRLYAGTAPPPVTNVLSTQGKQIVSPDGTPIKLTGWRMALNSYGKGIEVSPDDFRRYKEQGLLGNAQGVEIWWSRNTADNSVSEGLPHRPGVYNEAALTRLLETLRTIARSGSYIIPSIRVSYDQTAAIQNTKMGTNTWQGWADHRKVIYNAPVVVEEGPNAGTYGRHRDRFFAWLDWILPKILADKEIADAIAYWEMWHYYGHRHGSTVADRDHYLDDFMPRLITKYREHDPDRLLGVGLALDATVTQLIQRIENKSWSPYPEKQLIYVIGGYGIHDLLMRQTIQSTATTWPINSNNPAWIAATSEFNIQKLSRISGLPMHSQEGPGLIAWHRETPIPTLQRTWLIGLYNLYNASTNGFGFHDWPPSRAGNVPLESYKKTTAFNETDFFNVVREALKGNQVTQ